MTLTALYVRSSEQELRETPEQQMSEAKQSELTLCQTEIIQVLPGLELQKAS